MKLLRNTINIENTIYFVMKRTETNCEVLHAIVNGESIIIPNVREYNVNITGELKTTTIIIREKIY